jgi:signal transduction histidine kinase
VLDEPYAALVSSSRPVAWVPPVLYAAVAAAGLYAGAAGLHHQLGHTRPVALMGGLALLLLIDLVEHRRYPRGTPVAPAVALLAVRIGLYLLVGTADGSGVSRALFVLVPLTAYFAFGRAASIVVAVACVAALVVSFAVTVPRWYADAERVSDLLMLALGLVLAVTMAAIAVEERRLRLRLERSNERLREYADEVAALSTAAERNRLARDIHDGLGHHLTEAAILLEQAVAVRDSDPAGADTALTEAHRAVRQALDDVRRSVRALHPGAPPFRLSTAVTDLARTETGVGVGGAASGGGPSVSVDVTGEEDGQPLLAMTALYRAAQEGITNARRHAGAARVQVRLDFGPSATTLVVSDDGRGFTPDGGGFGLAGMRERVEQVGGRVRIDSAPGAGTRLTVTVPAA